MQKQENKKIIKYKKENRNIECHELCCFWSDFGFDIINLPIEYFFDKRGQ